KRRPSNQEARASRIPLGARPVSRRRETPMKTMTHAAAGGREQLKLVYLADPGQPGPGEIRVRIHGSSLNYHDYLVANGTIPSPEGRILMSDGGGVVEA